MNVLLNGMATIEQKSGVGHHIECLHRELARTWPDGTVKLFPGDRMRPVAARLAPRTRSFATARVSSPTTATRWLGRAVKETGRAAAQAYFTAYAKANGIGLYHEPNFIPFHTSLPTVVTVHDLSVQLFPEWHPAERVAVHERKFRPAVERAAHVITVSEQVRRELLALIPLDPKRVSAIPNGIGPEFRRQTESETVDVRDRLDLPDRFLLYVGNIEPRKNLLVALRAYVDLPASLRERCPLLLAGNWAWKSSDVADFFRDRAAPAGVRHLGYVSDNDRVALYNAAAALIYPSRYEGFGLPPVEMLACGGGVIAATADAVKEVLGRHGHFVDPDDVAGWRDAMAGVAADDDFLAATRKGGIGHAKQFTWGRAARETMAVYRNVLGLPQTTFDSHRAAA